MSRRNDEPAGTPMRERNHAQEIEWEREQMLKIARTWVGNVDYLERKGMLEMSVCAMTQACISIVRLQEVRDYWHVHRVLEALERIGRPVDEETNKNWLARLRAYREPEYMQHHSDKQSTWEEIA